MTKLEALCVRAEEYKELWHIDKATRSLLDKLTQIVRIQAEALKEVEDYSSNDLDVVFCIMAKEEAETIAGE